MGQLYGQDCGSYSLRLEPELPGVATLVKSEESPFTDSLVLGPVAARDAGTYQVSLVVE